VIVLHHFKFTTIALDNSLGGLEDEETLALGSVGSSFVGELY
jgi:hypothetical protein